MRSITASSLVAVLALGLGAAAGAQTSATPRKVDRNELRYCLDTGDSLKGRTEALGERSKKIKAQQEALKTEGEELQAERERLEKSSSMLGMSRDRVERRMSAYNDKVNAARADAEQFRPDAETLNKDLAAYNQRCGGISYDPADREAIMKEREAARK